MTPPAGDASHRPDSAADDAEARRLVERIHAGERALATDLYVRYFGRLYGFVCSLLDDDAAAEDVTHEVFEGLLKALDSGELGNVASLRRWLFTVARNRAIDHLRHHRRLELMSPPEIRERIAHLLRRESREQANRSGWAFDDPALAAALRPLPPRQREVVLLRYFGDFDMAVVAATIGSSEGSVKEAHRRALASLRARMAPAATPESPRRRPPLAMSQLSSDARRVGHSFSSRPPV